MPSAITIYLSDSSASIKDLIAELKALDHPQNPYFDQSESRIAGAILRKFLPAEHENIIRECGQK